MKFENFRRSLALAASVCALAYASPGFTQTAAARGQTIVIPDSTRRLLLQQVKAPEGFEVTLFAAPPHVIYPTCIASAPGGVLFVCVDPNSSLDQEPGRGRILRLVDENGDGVADRYTVFADSIDSPRGLVYDGRTLFVMHPPTLSALRDTDGDGVADKMETLVRGLGFDLNFRGADHTTNGIEMGVDGWIYIALGDYGVLKAIGRDGKQLHHRGGGVVRVRPDGTEIELYASGTRNIYDLAVDPFLNLFSRDNTNDGEGWDIRLHHLTPRANMGYPSLFKNFPDEHVPSLADYGAGSGTGGLWVHDPGFPEGFNNTLFTADWTLSKVFRHPLQPKGATFEVQQEEFLSIPRPTDMVMDEASHMYVASWMNGQYRYQGDNVGFIVRVSYPGKPGSRFPRLASLRDAKLVDVLTSPNAVHRFHAQREILRRNPTSGTVRRLEELILDRRQPDYVRVAAAWTLKQLVGPRSHGVLVRVAEDPDPLVRASALRALADRKGELQDVPVDLFVRALSDPDPRVQLQAVHGLGRLGAREAADAIVPLLASSDRVVAFTAVETLVELGAVEAALKALDSGSPAVAGGALRVLQRIHSPATVTALLERVRRAPDAQQRRRLLGALARLYHREAVWTGEWWSTRPNTDGPYYEPVAWEESGRIRPALVEALVAAQGEEFEGLVAEFARNRVLPAGSEALLGVLTRTRDARRAEVIGLLVGRRVVDPDAFPLLTRLAAGGAELRRATLQLLVAQPNITEEFLPLLRAAATDAKLEASLRAQAITALRRLPGRAGVVAAAEAVATVTPLIGQEQELEQVWRRFVGDRSLAAHLDYFIELARSQDESRRVLAYSVLVQTARAPGQRSDEVRERAAVAIEAGWADRTRAASLVRAIQLMRAERLYEERLKAYQQAAS
ncbi:MAG TPA: PVC-type heme-binding CxxCH protein [Longimicrobiales bacterium]